MISEIVSEFVERLAQSGATPEIITLFVTFASRVERDVWRDGRDAKQKTADRSKAYRKRKRDGRNVTLPLSSLLSSSNLTTIGKPLAEVVKEERVNVAGQELSDWPKDYQQLFWAAYPLKKAKYAAMKALDAVRKQKRATFAEVMAGLERYKATQNPEFYCHAATWLNQGRWLDQPLKPVEPLANGGWREGMPTTEELRAKYEKGAKMGQNKPVVQDGIRPRDDEQGMVGTETRKPGMGSLAGILRTNGMDAESIARKHCQERTDISYDAMPVARMATDESDGEYPFEGAL